MRRLQRTALSSKESQWLCKQTAKILAKPESARKTESDRLWKSAKQNQARNQLQPIQKKLQDMCSGLDRCMYCEDSQATAIEHFWPRSLRPQGAFIWENLLFACAHCNSNEKRTQFPQDANGQPLLIDPTAEDPLDHLVLVPLTGKFEPRIDADGQQSPKGRKSIDTYGLYRTLLEQGRRNAWVALKALLLLYDADLKANRDESADTVRQAICEQAFSSVLTYMLHFHQTARAALAQILPPDCLAVLDERPEISQWSK